MYWTGFDHGTLNAMKPGGPARVIASGLPGLNSLALDARGRLFGSQVFAGVQFCFTRSRCFVRVVYLTARRRPSARMTCSEIQTCRWLVCTPFSNITLL